jgi:Pyruvate/2-oxoacid:ferredoxin oxidoreductase delta subunit
MRKFSFITVVGLIGINTTMAQLPTGSYAPDFKLFEIDKTTGSLITTDTIHLYEYLDAGKPTMLDISATWCGPCWSYHQAHGMRDAHNTYGPSGTDELRIVFIEGSYGNYASLSGTGSDAGGNASQGNWLNGTPYPMVPTNMSPNTKKVVTDYKIAFFPTLYMICPNRRVIQIEDRPDAAKIYNYAKGCPVFANIPDNAAIFNLFEPEGNYICVNEITPRIQIQNVGTSNLLSVEFAINIDGTSSTHTWNGNLNPLAVETISLPKLTGLSSAPHNYKVTITKANGNVDTDDVMNEITTSFGIQSESSKNSLNEDFSSSTFPNNGFWKTNKAKDEGWTRYANNAAIYFFSYYEDKPDTLYLPLLNLTGVANPGLGFDVANQAVKTGGKEYYDRLKVEVSTCGGSWTTIYNKENDLPTVSNFVTTGDQIGFLPNDTQWRREGIHLSSYLATGADKFRIRIIAIPNSNIGNIIWLDNIKVGKDAGVSVKEIGGRTNVVLYPNPVQDNLYISMDGNISQLEIFNIQGQCIKTVLTNNKIISTNDLASGFYMLRITTDKGVSVHKFVKQ